MMRSDESTRSAIILGGMGQDGHYLNDYLTASGYRVLRIARTGIISSSGSLPFDVLNSSNVVDLIAREQPREFYYLPAYHHASDENPGTLRQLFEMSYATHCQGLLNVLESIATHSLDTRLFYAASSLVFGEPKQAPQNEDTPMIPVCAYGVTKLAGIGLCRLYRRDRNVHCSSGILYNHESPRRADRFVTRKIVRVVSDIVRGKQTTLVLGDLEAQADWSFAGDIVRAMHAMLQLDAPQDFVVASGSLHTIRDFVSRAFKAVGIDYRLHVKQDRSVLQRPSRRVPLQGDASRLTAATDWHPNLSFDALVELMVRAQLSVDCGNA